MFMSLSSVLLCRFVFVALWIYFAFTPFPLVQEKMMFLSSCVLRPSSRLDPLPLPLLAFLLSLARPLPFPCPDSFRLSSHANCLTFLLFCSDRCVYSCRFLKTNRSFFQGFHALISSQLCHLTKLCPKLRFKWSSTVVPVLSSKVS